MPKARWCLLALASLLVDPTEVRACSCVGGLAGAGPAFQVWPEHGPIPRGAHLWVRRGAEARGEVALFAGSLRLPAEVRPAAGQIFEVIPAGPLPDSFEVRAGSEGAWTTLHTLQSSPALAGKLPAGGALERVDARDGDPDEICGNGSPRATLVFGKFAEEPRAPVPYAVWFSPGSSPLDLSRPPDRLIFAAGQELKVDGGSICTRGDFWLPTGEGEARLAAAAIDPDGTRHAPREVTFRAALTTQEQEQIQQRCRARHNDDRARMLAETARIEGMIDGHRQGSRRALLAATALGAAGAALLAAAQRRRQRRGLLASAVSFALGAAAALTSTHEDRQVEPLRAWQNEESARVGDGGHCHKLFPRGPKAPSRR